MVGKVGEHGMQVSSLPALTLTLTLTLTLKMGEHGMEVSSLKADIIVMKGKLTEQEVMY